MACHLISSMHAFRCALGHDAFIFIKITVRHGVLGLRQIGRTA